MNGRMKKQRNTSLIAKGEYTAWCPSILTRVSVASADGKHRVDDAIALWDTGATDCFVSRRLIDELKLKKIGEMDVRYADERVVTKDVYLVRLTFQPSGREIEIYASDTGEDSQDFIIGMNIIRNGRFLLEPTEDGVSFTFTI